MTQANNLNLGRSLDKPDVRPHAFVHAVFKSSRYDEMLAFYKTFLNAHVVMGNPLVSFLTYDDEHHRLAILNLPSLGDLDAGRAGLDHISYAYRTLGDLLANYLRLKKAGILPFWCINHGPTTSIYYRDPDGNQIETQFDNFGTTEELVAYFATKEFLDNPIGVQFDPDKLARRYLDGDPEEELARRGAAPIPDGAGYMPLMD